MKRQLSAPASLAPQKPLELLRNVVWLEGMPTEAADFLQSAARIKLFDAGDTITRQGENVTGIYLIVSGMVKVCSTHTNKAEVLTTAPMLLVLFRDSLLPRPENGPGTQAGKERVLNYLQAHARNDAIFSPKTGGKTIFGHSLFRVLSH